MNELEILYDHYKDTYENIKSKEKLRSTYFIISWVVIFLLLLFMIHPSESVNVFSEIIKQQYGADIIKIFPTIVSALWVLFLYVILRYYQICIAIERQYKYLHRLEEHLASSLGEIFSREGKLYEANYPILTNFIYILYTIIFPVLYIFFISIKLISEVLSSSDNFVFDLVIGCLLVLLIVFYFLSRTIHTKNKKENQL